MEGIWRSKLGFALERALIFLLLRLSLLDLFFFHFSLMLFEYPSASASVRIDRKEYQHHP